MRARLPRFQWIPAEKLDTVAYDQVLAASPHTRIYHQAWYQQIATPAYWGAFVLQEGDTWLGLAPVAWYRPWGLWRQAIQPLFCQQSGLLLRPELEAHRPVLERALMAELSRRFIFYHYGWHSGSALVQSDFFKHGLRPNQYLPLPDTFEELMAGFTPETRNSVRRALEVPVVEQAPWNICLDLLQQSLSAKEVHLKAADYARLSHIAVEARNRGQAFWLGAEEEGGKLGACALFLQDEHRVYYLAAAATDVARKAKAPTALLAHAWKQHVGTGRIFDFEGSRLPGVSRFFSSFGAQEEKWLLTERRLRRFW